MQIPAPKIRHGAPSSINAVKVMANPACTEHNRRCDVYERQDGNPCDNQAMGQLQTSFPLTSGTYCIVAICSDHQSAAYSKLRDDGSIMSLKHPTRGVGAHGDV